MNNENEAALILEDVCHDYHQGNSRIQIANHLNLHIKAGQMIALVGRSGLGKSTILHIAGLLETPVSGQVFIKGQNSSQASDVMRTKLRCEHIGFVYQSHRLLGDFTALENVMMPLLIQGCQRHTALQNASDLLEQFGLGHRLQHRPAQLSGGEQQRVAIARALVKKPALLLADEPTGNLDPDTADQVFAIFREIMMTFNVAALIATHNQDLALQMEKRVTLQDGQAVFL